MTVVACLLDTLIRLLWPPLNSVPLPQCRLPGSLFTTSALMLCVVADPVVPIRTETKRLLLVPPVTLVCVRRLPVPLGFSVPLAPCAQIIPMLGTFLLTTPLSPRVIPSARLPLSALLQRVLGLPLLRLGLTIIILILRVTPLVDVVPARMAMVVNVNNRNSCACTPKRLSASPSQPPIHSRCVRKFYGRLLEIRPRCPR